MHTINQVFLGQINECLSVIIINEHQRHILPLIASKMDAINSQIHTDVGHKLLALDQCLKESIGKMCTSKVIDFKLFFIHMFCKNIFFVIKLI